MDGDILLWRGRGTVSCPTIIHLLLNLFAFSQNCASRVYWRGVGGGGGGGLFNWGWSVGEGGVSLSYQITPVPTTVNTSGWQSAGLQSSHGSIFTHFIFPHHLCLGRAGPGEAGHHQHHQHELFWGGEGRLYDRSKQYPAKSTPPPTPATVYKSRLGKVSKKYIFANQ